MELELVPDSQTYEDGKPEAVVAFGYDPKNSADRLRPDERYFLVDAIAEYEREKKLQDTSGLPKNTIDWVNDFCRE